jgi:hypothetical protein
LAYLLEVHVIDPGDNTIKVTHQFWGVTQAECRDYFREHKANCEYFAAAVTEKRVIEEMQQVDESELPEPEDFEEFEEEEAG